MEKPLGSEGGLKLEIKDGKVVLSVSYDGKGLDGGVTLALEGDYFVDKLGGLFPGDSAIEMAILAGLKLALRSVKV